MINSRLARMNKQRIPFNSHCLKYPTGEEVPIKFKIKVLIKLGNISKELPVFVADIGEDCLLGADFLAAVNLENIFEPIFGNPDLGKEENFVCSRIQKFEDVPQFLKELFERETKDLNENQKDFFAQFLIDNHDIFSEEIGWKL